VRHHVRKILSGTTGVCTIHIAPRAAALVVGLMAPPPGLWAGGLPHQTFDYRVPPRSDPDMPFYTLRS
jgi:hypothetical protein